MSHHDWTTTFFGGLAVEFWLNVAPPPSEAEIEFLRATFSGGEILDLACGGGRYTIPLSAAGFRMTGVDISTDFLAVAASRAPRVEWIHADMRDLEWRDRFDGALCFGNSFAYFDRIETGRFLRGVAAALKPGANFVLESAAIAESLLPALQRQRWMQVGDILFLSASKYDAKQSRLDIEYSFIKDGRREIKMAHTWIYTAREVTEMLADSGFEVLEIDRSPLREPFELGSPRAFFVSQCTRS